MGLACQGSLSFAPTTPVDLLIILYKYWAIAFSLA